MATKEQVFSALAAASDAMSRAQLEEAVGESYRQFQTQLGRWEKAELIEDTGEHHYILTEKGRAETLADEFSAAEHAEQPGQSDESVGATEYQKFLSLGKQSGVANLPLIKQTTEHIWAGGDVRDLTWVGRGLQEMGIRQDVLRRWFHSWRSYLNQPLPTDLPQELLNTKAEGKDGDRRESTGKRDYMLSEENTPVKVGVGAGDMEYQDAIDLAKIRAARGKGNGAPATPGTMADEIGKVFAVFKNMMGEKAEGRSWMMKPGENGWEVEEWDPSRPVLPPSQGPTPAKGWLVNVVDGEPVVSELDGGKPSVVVIKDEKQGPAAGVSRQLIDRHTGVVEDVPAGGVVVIREPAPAASQATPIQVKDKDGNPMVLDLSTYIQLEEHHDNQRRDEESHQTKMDVARGFKDLLKSAQKAMAKMGDEEE